MYIRIYLVFNEYSQYSALHIFGKKINKTITYAYFIIILHLPSYFIYQK